MKSIINVGIIEPEKKHLSTIIFLHGLGENISQKIFDNFVKKCFLHTKFILPQGSLKSIKVKGWESVSLANAWYSIGGDFSEIQTEKQLEEVERQVKINKKELLKSRTEISEIIEQEVSLGILPQNIIIGGYSQGASMALIVGLTSSRALGGIVCLAGFLPCYQEVLELAKSNNKKIPILVCHGKQDTTVPYWVGEKTAQILKDNGYHQARFKSYQCDHTLNTKLFEDAINFSKSVFLEKEINFDDEKGIN